MSWTKLVFVAFAFFGISTSVLGQQQLVSSNSTLQTPKEYYLQVKQFGEFIDRFNYKSDWSGKLITPEFAQKVSRASYLGYLLNADDIRLSGSDSSYSKLCSEFIAFIDEPNNPKTISLFSGQVKACAKVNITYGGKNQKAKLELTPEILDDRSAKWTISKVDASCFAAIKDSLRANFIAPNSHETNFINIKKLNSNTDPIYFFSNALATDPTLLFLSEVAKNRIAIKNIEQVKYTITFSGWEIAVEEFSRNSTNSGWLISNIRKVNPEQ